MKSATVTEFKKHPDWILKIAEQEPLTVTERGKPLFIIHKASAPDALERAKAATQDSPR